MDEQELIRMAHKAREKAYAPYSKFKVGAALLTKTDRVYTGSNVENKSYGLTVCAERNAVSAAISDGERDFVAIVISSTSKPPAPPCGACRQVLKEFSGDIKVIMVNAAGDRKIRTVAELLPEPFGAEDA
ncbi:cytidine deaminase [candidate division TA06 bacterium]|uniref:Cytidine deaminase n=1 Tax=candidate division TA06 bacterium TaxID=2250710 RepID=A0A523XLK4_UNCT6|nr:MAG: cytidine deaminase [candidate division TA06 bacterium]